MATFKQYTLKNGSKKWLFKTYLGIDEVTGKQITTTRRGFFTRKEAVLAEKRLQHEVIENGFNKKKVTTFKELYELWLEQYRLRAKESSIARTTYFAKNQILPVFGTLKLEKISVSFCQQTVNKWHTQYKSYSSIRGMTNQILNYGVSLELMESNPMLKTTLPRKFDQDKKLNFYTKDELAAFLSAAKENAPHKVYTFFRLLAYTGMRKSEALALQWNDINFTENLLTIGKTLALNEAGRVIVQTPKTNSSTRVISIDDGTITILKSWRKKQKEEYIMRGYNTMNKQQYIFTNDLNTYLTPQVTRGWLNAIYDRVELKKISTHGFRHTHCSLLFESGVSVKEVQERLGHKDIKTTMNIYTHVTETSVKKTGDLFAKYMDA